MYEAIHKPDRNPVNVAGACTVHCKMAIATYVWLSTETRDPKLPKILYNVVQSLKFREDCNESLQPSRNSCNLLHVRSYMLT